MKKADNVRLTFASLESLRGLMCWWVVIGHAIHLTGTKTQLGLVGKYLVRGDSAVNVFIIVSGFVITHLLVTRSDGYLAYIKQRAFRLYPIYAFCCLAAYFLSSAYVDVYINPWVQEYQMRLIRETATNASFGWHFLLHVFMLHGIVPEEILPFSSSSLLAPAWSLSLEWQFYLLAPFVVPALLRMRLKALPLLLLLVLLVVFTKLQRWFSWQYPSFLPLSLPFFLLGIYSRIFLEKFSALNPVLILALGCLIVVVVPGARLEALIWTIFFVSCTCENRSLSENGLERLIVMSMNSLTRNTALASLGRVSYSTYLVHVPLFVAVASLWSSLSAAVLDQTTVIWTTIVACVVLVPLSYALYSAVERPFIRLGKKRVSETRSVVCPESAINVTRSSQ